MKTEEQNKLAVDLAVTAFKARPKTPSGRLERQENLKKYTNNTCTCSSVIIMTTRSNHGEELRGIVEFDLTAFNLTPDSLLLKVLEGVPCPFNYHCTASLRKFLRLHEEHPEVREIVKMSVYDCKGWELPKLLHLIEDYVAGKSINWKAGLSFAIRSVFIHTEAKYPNDSAMAIAGFNSRFPVRPPKDNRKSMELADKGKEDLLGKPFLEGFDTFEERNQKSLKILLRTRADLNAVCDRIFADYESTKDAINAAADLGPPDLNDARLHKMVRRRICRSTLVNFTPDLRRLSAEEQLRIYATFSRRENFPFSKPKSIDVSTIPILRTNAERDTPGCMFEILISTHFLPSMVVTCVGNL